MTIKRYNSYLADIQLRRLKAIQKKTGLPLSDILRRAIDEYWERYIDSNGYKRWDLFLDV